MSFFDKIKDFTSDIFKKIKGEGTEFKVSVSEETILMLIGEAIELYRELKRSQDKTEDEIKVLIAQKEIKIQEQFAEIEKRLGN